MIVPGTKIFMAFRFAAVHIMAKKRKVSSNAAETEPSTGWNDQGGKLRAVNTYEDIADSEDEFHANRDKIMLDDGPDAKRRRKWQEEGNIIYLTSI